MSSQRRHTLSVFIHVVLMCIGVASIPLYYWERSTRLAQQEHISLALTASDAGVWFWNLETQKLEWDKKMFELFGVDSETWDPNYGGFERCLHPEDRDRVNDMVSKAIETGRGYRATFRVIDATGGIRMIRAAGKVSYDKKYMTGLCLPAIPQEGFIAGLPTVQMNDTLLDAVTAPKL
jgi:PAS domain-containing protein